MITFLALAHMLDATQMVWGGGGDNVSRTNSLASGEQKIVWRGISGLPKRFFLHVIPISCSSHCKCHNLG